MTKPSTDVELIASLQRLDLEGLRAVWRERFGAPPSLRSVDLLARMMAWRIQVEAIGGFDAELKRMLRRPPGTRRDAGPQDGTQLVREWQGVRHEVIATNDGGFLYDGVRYASLSLIARRITGSRWNGPRFFGLRQVAGTS